MDKDKKAFLELGNILVDLFPDKTEISVIGWCLDYDKHKGTQAVRDMIAFYHYATAEEKSTDYIRMEISHDLAGAKDKLMLPRTDGYEDFYNHKFKT